MKETDNPGIYFPPPLLFVSALVLGILYDGNLLDWRHVTHLVQALGVAVALAGLALILTSLGLFRRFGTRPEPWEASSSLIRSGLYRISRNPMYLGMAVTSAGIAIYFESLAAGILLAVVVVAIDRIVIAREELYLARRFGEDYRAYCATVRRWL
jgi:protein-S-isoprenylcysteine O-methyltransferase Ste14